MTRTKRDRNVAVGAPVAKKTKDKPKVERVGSIRPSQILHTYGVGALIDLPNFSVAVVGLQAWKPPQPGDEVQQERLLRAVQAELGPQVERLVRMPWLPESQSPFDDWARVGIPVVPFPRWLSCSACNLLSTVDGGLFALRAEPVRISRTEYQHTGCPKRKRAPRAVPARFVMACKRGHLDEFPWNEFAHDFLPCQKPDGGHLELSEVGAGTRSTNVVITCTGCGQSKGAASAFDHRSSTGLRCRGRHPHLRRFEECDEIAQPLLLGASNTWFGITRSALSIPGDTASDIDRVVSNNWDELGDTDIASLQSLKLVLKHARMPELDAYASEDIWSAIERRRAGTQPGGVDPTDLKFPEWERLIDPTNAPQEDDFQVEAAAVSDKFQQRIEKVVAVHRLRETSALIGFARIEAPEIDGEAEIAQEAMVPLSTTEQAWIPISDVRGEGVLIQFPEALIAEWEETMYADARLVSLRERWQPREWPGARYVALHSLSHLLINELAIECGYSAASLRERIYCRTPRHGGEPMAGILIYTAAADSEGTLGGLVAMASPDRLGAIFEAALRRAERCSSDPLCAEHVASSDDGTYHGAACHSCLFLPETSCERNNRLLERASLVDTLGHSGLGYFGFKV